MRTACLLWPPSGEAGDVDPGPARLVRQLRALGSQRVVVMVTGEVPGGLDDVEIRGAPTWALVLDVLEELAADADALDLLDGALVAHDAALEELLVPPGHGAHAALGTGRLGELPALVEDGQLTDVAVPDEVVDHPAASGTGPTVAGALHVGGDALRALTTAFGRLRGVVTGAGPSDGTATIAWIIRALVRDGVAVATVDARGAVLRRVVDERQRMEVRRDLDGVDEERRRLDRSVKARDGFFTTYFVSTYSRYLARWCARRGLSPDQITVASLLVGLLAAAAFAAGTLTATILGAVALQVAFTLDCVDGQLARYARRFSARGAWLDAVFDRTKEYAVYAGLAIGAVRTGAEVTVWWLAGGALALQALRHHLDFAFTVHREAREAPRPVRDLAQPADWVRASTGSRPAHEQVQPWARGGLLGAARRVERIPGLRWGKSIVILPIGERFAAISLGAVLLGARGTFLLLLGWGTVAAGYLVAGRVLRSLRSSADGPAEDPQQPFLDLGPIGRRLPRTRLPGTVLVLTTLAVGIAAPLVAAAGAAVVPVLVAVSLLAGLLQVAARPPGALGWLGPPALRAAEYGGVLALAWWAGTSAAAVTAFALISLVAYHHYDSVYRDRFSGAAPPRWLGDALGGWEGRLAVTLAATVAGVPTVGLAVLTVWTGTLAVTESVIWWRRATG